MLPDEKKLQLFISVYYPLSLMLSLTANILLLYIMKTTRSALLKDIKYYLVNTTIFEIIVSLSTFIGQCRPVANTTTLAVFCYGPCKYFGRNTCFFNFAIVQSSVVAADVSSLLCFCYRYTLLQIHVHNTMNHKKVLALFSLFPISMLIFQLSTDSDFDIVERETRLMHPDYDYTNNSLIGFSNTKGLGGIIAQSAIALGFYLSPFIAFYYRRKINKILIENNNNNIRRIPVALCKQLINGLVIQTLVPFFVYIPPYSYFLYSQFAEHSNLYPEYLLNILGSVTAFVNPLLTFYFVLPYRRALCKKFCNYFPSEGDTDETTYPATGNFQRRYTATTKF